MEPLGSTSTLVRIIPTFFGRTTYLVNLIRTERLAHPCVAPGASSSNGLPSPAREHCSLDVAVTLGGVEFYPFCMQICLCGYQTVFCPSAYNDNDPGMFYPSVDSPGSILHLPWSGSTTRRHRGVVRTSRSASAGQA
jgi:hypothetical protein